jgi:hypothetical protein
VCLYIIQVASNTKPAPTSPFCSASISPTQHHIRGNHSACEGNQRGYNHPEIRKASLYKLLGDWSVKRGAGCQAHMNNPGSNTADSTMGKMRGDHPEKDAIDADCAEQKEANAKRPGSRKHSACHLEPLFLLRLNRSRVRWHGELLGPFAIILLGDANPLSSIANADVRLSVVVEHFIQGPV